jgi:hypothetical protein
MPIRHRLRAAFPLGRPGPIAAACAVAAAVAVVLALTVLPADADPSGAAPTPTGIASPAPRAHVAGTPMTTATATAGSSSRALRLQTAPSPTPRVIRRPPPSPTVTPTATPHAPVLSDEQLVANRGFEAPDVWYLEPGATIATGDAHRGDRYLFIGSTGGYADQRFVVEAGVTYRVAAWARVSGPGASAARIGLRYDDAAYNTVAPVEPVAIAESEPTWRKVVFTFTPPDGVTRALITFWNPPGGAALSIDDVSIRAVITE